MTKNLFQYLPFLFLLAVGGLALFIALTPLDAAFALWIGGLRSCWLDYTVFIIEDHALTVLLLLGGAALITLCLRGRWEDARHVLLTVLFGGFCCELLKTGFERPRPSVVPPLLVGNSFPSGHVTTALLIAGTLIFLLFRGRLARWVKVSGAIVLTAAVGVTVWQRLYLGHHWLSDVAGSILLVGAWLFFALPRPDLWVFSRKSVALVGCLLVSYGGFYFFPAFRFFLPSTLAAIGDPVVSVAFGQGETREVLQGSWGDHFQKPASTWMNQGEASVEVLLPKRQEYLLKIAVRPLLQSRAFACFPLEIAVNRRQVGSLLLYRGWREYSLRFEPDWVVPGLNTITFRAGAAFPENGSDQRRVAFLHLRVFAED